MPVDSASYFGQRERERPSQASWAHKGGADLHFDSLQLDTSRGCETTVMGLVDRVVCTRLLSIFC